MVKTCVAIVLVPLVAYKATLTFALMYVVERMIRDCKYLQLHVSYSHYAQVIIDLLLCNAARLNHVLCGLHIKYPVPRG